LVLKIVDSTISFEQIQRAAVGCASSSTGVAIFSSDGTEIYYGKFQGSDEGWAVPTLGGKPNRVASGLNIVPSPDGKYIYYLKVGSRGIFRTERSRLSEEQVYVLDPSLLLPRRILPFPDGNHLLVFTHDAISLLPLAHGTKWICPITRSLRWGI
jgi:hypothetical protein